MGHDEITAGAARARWRPVVLLLGAVAAVVAIPLVYGGGLAYGASWLEWDAAHATYFYAERPGGFAVVVASWALILVLVAGASVLGALSILGFIRRRR